MNKKNSPYKANNRPPNTENKLNEYFAKRDFTLSPEPRGQSLSLSDIPIFVIQKHAARNLHYDFRLEVDCVLKSWAIPKGPSTDPAQNRLAVATEDHPLDYADFEGVIPQGNYGAGEVIIWDKGYYANTSVKNGQDLTMTEALDKGHVFVWLEGQKLKGGYHLIRTKDNQWLFKKSKDQHANPSLNITESRPESIMSGQTIEDLR